MRFEPFLSHSELSSPPSLVDFYREHWIETSSGKLFSLIFYDKPELASKAAQFAYFYWLLARKLDSLLVNKIHFSGSLCRTSPLAIHFDLHPTTLARTHRSIQ